MSYPNDQSMDAGAIPVRVVSGGGGGGYAGVARTPTMGAPVNGPGTVAAGAVSVSFYNTGAADATVTGQPLAAGQVATFQVTAPDSLAAIAYDATGTTMVITKVA